MATLNINGKVRDVEVEADTPLLWVIREQVGLTGTKYGCGVAQCGACSVHINGEVDALLLDSGRARSSATDRIVTIEGLSADQLASGAEGVGWRSTFRSAATANRGRSWPPRRCCAKKPNPTDADIDEAMTNICRCGTYQRIRAAVHMAAGMQASPRPDQRAEGATPRRSLMKKTNAGQDRRICRAAGSSSARPQSRAAASRSGCTLPFGIGAAAATRSARRGDAEVNAWVVVKPDETLRDPHRALGDGPGHDDRPRAARRRGARVRLEEGRRPNFRRRARTSRASASGARWAPAAAAASARRRTTCAAAARRRG